MTLGALLYFMLLVLWSAAVAYFILFKLLGGATDPNNAHQKAVAAAAHIRPAPGRPVPEPPRSYSTHEGFKSFQKGDRLTVEDIVKGLSQEDARY